MTSRLTYHLAGVRGWWSVWQEHQTMPVFQARNKLEAVSRARALAKQNGARLVIHSETGEIKADLAFHREGA